MDSMDRAAKHAKIQKYDAPEQDMFSDEYQMPEKSSDAHHSEGRKELAQDAEGYLGKLE